MKHKWLTITLVAAMALGATALIWAEVAAGPAPGAAAAPAAQLTPDQQTQLHAKIQEMKAAGATPDQIRDEAYKMVKGWGLDPGVRQRPKWMQALTPEQRAQVLAKVQGLKQAGKTPEEIHAAIVEMLKGWGIQPPANMGPGEGKPGRFLAQLTPEQRRQLMAKYQELQQAGKTPQEIHAAISETLKGWGIQPPAGGGAGGWGKLAQWREKLTPEQRQQVTAKAQEMRQEGKAPQEIRAAIREMAKGWGIQVPEAPTAPKLGQGGLLQQLTPERRAQVVAKYQELKQAGKTREEIRAAVQEMLKGWGIQPPAPAPQPAQVEPNA